MLKRENLRPFLKPSTGIGRGHGRRSSGGGTRISWIGKNGQRDGEREKMQKLVQTAPIGTEINVRSENRDSNWGYSQDERYRITGTPNDKRLVATKESTREYFHKQGIDSFALDSRETLSMLIPMFDEDRSVTIKRTPLTEQERQARQAERRRGKK